MRDQKAVSVPAAVAAMALLWDARFRGYEGDTDGELRRLVDAIVAGDELVFSQRMEGSSGLASAGFSGGATRQGPELDGSFLKEIGH